VKKRTVTFRELVHAAMALQRRGLSVGGAARSIAPHCREAAEALQVARAAQVHARWLARESRVQWL
jgi:hypothetical protein